MKYLNYTLSNIAETSDNEPEEKELRKNYSLHGDQIEQLYFNSQRKTLAMQLFNPWDKFYIELFFLNTSYFECDPKLLLTDPSYFGMSEVLWKNPLEYNQLKDNESSPQDLVCINDVSAVPASKPSYPSPEWDESIKSPEYHLYFELYMFSKNDLRDYYKVPHSPDDEAYHFIRLDAEKTMAHEYTDPSKSLIPKVDFSRLNWDTGEIS